MKSVMNYLLKYEHDFREWLIFIDIKTKQNIEYLKDVWFTSGLEKYKDLNKKKEVSLFHLNDRELSAKSIKFI